MIAAILVTAWFVLGISGYNLGMAVEQKNVGRELHSDDVWIVIFGPIVFAVALAYAVEVAVKKG